MEELYSTSSLSVLSHAQEQIEQRAYSPDKKIRNLGDRLYRSNSQVVGHDTFANPVSQKILHYD